jgi:hypothetical protein
MTEIFGRSAADLQVSACRGLRFRLAPTELPLRGAARRARWAEQLFRPELRPVLRDAGERLASDLRPGEPRSVLLQPEAQRAERREHLPPERQRDAEAEWRWGEQHQEPRATVQPQFLRRARPQPV